VTTVTATGRLPKYEQVAASLTRRIAAMHPHEPIPTERELMRQFGVSRMTVRNALAKLVSRGLIYNVQGSGTYVAPPEVVTKTLRLTSFSEDMAQRGHVPASRVIDRREDSADAATAAALGLAVGAPVLVVERLRLADGVPMALERVTLAPLPEGFGLDANGSLYAQLKGAGILVSRATQTIEAVNLGREEARFLDQAVGAAALRVRRTTYTDRGQAIELAETIYRADRYSFDVVVERAD
jgi:GntR family transcriptional regulator